MAANTLLRRKFVVINNYIRKTNTSKQNKLKKKKPTFYLKTLEKDQSKPKVNEETIFSIEFNERETRKKQ